MKIESVHIFITLASLCKTYASDNNSGVRAIDGDAAKYERALHSMAKRNEHIRRVFEEEKKHLDLEFEDAKSKGWYRKMKNVAKASAELGQKMEQIQEGVKRRENALMKKTALSGGGRGPGGPVVSDHTVVSEHMAEAQEKMEVIAKKCNKMQAEGKSCEPILTKLDIVIEGLREQGEVEVADHLEAEEKLLDPSHVKQVHTRKAQGRRGPGVEGRTRMAQGRRGPGVEGRTRMAPGRRGVE